MSKMMKHDIEADCIATAWRKLAAAIKRNDYREAMNAQRIAFDCYKRLRDEVAQLFARTKK
jgi:uncharacterized protein (UPF0261 family)